MKYRVYEDENYKCVRSELYNTNFNKKTGYFERWGKTKEDDPICAPGPEILDMEISTICDLNCKKCYKSNTSVGKNMSLETVKKVLNKFGKMIPTQTAYGIGSVKGNPELFDILNYTRGIGCVPNITINGHNISDEEIRRFSEVLGAIAISHYNDECFDCVKRFTDTLDNPNTTLKQINIHQILSRNSLDECYKVIDSIKSDSRLAKLNALVSLSLKPKMRVQDSDEPLNSISEFNKLFKYGIDRGISLGFDSCGSVTAFQAAKEFNMPEIVQSIESCCSSLFSSYIDVDAFYHPCSFSVGENEWQIGMNVLEVDDFIKDIWNSEQVNRWRQNLLSMSKDCVCDYKKFCRPCPMWKNVSPCLK